VTEPLPDPRETAAQLELPVPSAIPAAPVLDPSAFYPASATPLPGSTVPIPVVVMAPPPQRGAALTIALAVVAGVLLLVAGGAGTLYYRDHTNSQHQVADLQAQLDDAQQKLSDTQDNLKRTQGELADAKACADAVDAFWKVVLQVTGGGANATTANAAMTDMLKSCGVSV
jgi:hypothetical protein